MKKLRIIDHISWIRFPDCSKLAVNWKNDKDVRICWHEVIVGFFCCLISLTSSLVIGRGFTSLSLLVLELRKFWFIRDLTGNWKYPVWVLSNIWRLGRVSDTKFDMNASYEKLLNAIKCQVYCFYRFWGTRENQEVCDVWGREPNPNQIRVKSDRSSLQLLVQPMNKTFMKTSTL